MNQWVKTAVRNFPRFFAAMHTFGGKLAKHFERLAPGHPPLGTINVAAHARLTMYS